MSEQDKQFNPFTYKFSLPQFDLLVFRGDKGNNYQATQVLLFKKVPFDATELDLVEICKPFGTIEDVCIIKTKGYAFVQFKEVESSQKCYETFKESEPSVKNSKIYVFYTGKTEIYKPERSNAYPSKYLTVVIEGVDEEIDQRLPEELMLKFAKPLQIMTLRKVPLTVLAAFQDVESALRVKEGLTSKRFLRGAQMSVSFVPEKAVMDFMTDVEDDPLSPILKNFGINSHENSVVSSPLFLKERSTSEINEKEFLLTDSPTKINDNSKTVMVRNLPKGTTPDDLFKLFGMYGNVMKVKIFYKSPDNGLVQFQECNQASLAKKYLNNCPFKDKILLVSLSKSEIASFSQECNEFFKDFSNQKGHRYRKVGSKNFKNIAQPSQVLHLSNLNPDKDPQFYIDLFKECGEVAQTMILSGESTTVLIEMATLREAVEALVTFHNFELDGKYLKVSFSKYENIKFL